MNEQGVLGSTASVLEMLISQTDLVKSIVIADPSQTTAELAFAFDVSKKTILDHSPQIDKIKKFDK